MPATTRCEPDMVPAFRFEASCMQVIPKGNRMQGHQEGNGYVVFTYAICFCAALCSTATAATMFIYQLTTQTGIFAQD